jgi:23S rRNA (adenine2503-C2)-methyltransferase
MRVKAWTGSEDVAVVYVAEAEGGRHVEFVESVEPPLTRGEKWVLIVSTLFGCPGGCRFCDAGGSYGGKLSAEEILFQTDYMIDRRYADRRVPAAKFKVQMARMGEPSLNGAVLDVLEELPSRYDAPGLMPAISTIAPAGREAFFERLLEISRGLYGGRFQLQFSLHTTDPEKRDWLVPPKKWDLETIAAYGERFFLEGGRKITLNFALAEGMPLDAAALFRHFDPAKFLVKLTPVNPTCEAERSGVKSSIIPGADPERVTSPLRDAGYEVIVSIGELEENHIGSNCGQFIRRYLEEGSGFRTAYNYSLVDIYGDSDRPAEPLKG